MAKSTHGINDPSVHPAALDTIETAAYLSVERATLKKWRTLGIGPTYARLGSKIVYRIVDLDAWLEANLVGGARR